MLCHRRANYGRCYLIYQLKAFHKKPIILLNKQRLDERKNIYDNVPSPRMLRMPLQLAVMAYVTSTVWPRSRVTESMTSAWTRPADEDDKVVSSCLSFEEVVSWPLAVNFQRRKDLRKTSGVLNRFSIGTRTRILSPATALKARGKTVKQLFGYNLSRRVSETNNFIRAFWHIANCGSGSRRRFKSLPGPKSSDIYWMKKVLQDFATIIYMI